MKSKWISPLLSGSLAVLCMAAIPQVVLADRLEFMDGRQLEGIIKKVEGGQVTFEVDGETKTFSILDLSHMEFDTPQLTSGTARLPLEHFTGSMESREVAAHVQAVEKVAVELRELLDQTRHDWVNRKTINPADVAQWDKAKDKFQNALSRYQETLNDLYFHVLGKVDEYNSMTKEANNLYVGVKGVFNIGSPLVSKEMRQLPLKKYVPAQWYNTIFYSGYEAGYSKRADEERESQHEPQ
jgi:hypothetical protein